MKKITSILIVMCIIFGTYEMIIDNDKKVGYAAFVFGVLAFVFNLLLNRKTITEINRDSDDTKVTQILECEDKKIVIINYGCINIENLNKIKNNNSSNTTNKLIENKDVEISDKEEQVKQDIPLKVTNLRWNNEKIGEVIFYNPNEDKVLIRIYLLDGEGSIISTFCGFSGRGSFLNKSDVRVSFAHDIIESGNYTYRVKVFRFGEMYDDDLSTGCVSEKSSVFKYNKPSIQLQLPSCIIFSNDGNATWTKVNNAERYWCNLYYLSDAKYNLVEGHMTKGDNHDFSDKISENKNYYVKIKTLSGNINKYANSEWSEYIRMD